MEMRYLGTSGIEVSTLCLGTWMFGQLGNPDHDSCVDIIRQALDSGINTIDTGDVYNAGESEEIVGRALKGRREDVIVVSKGSQGATPNRRGGSRRWIHQTVENSLRRLDTEWIDVYLIHRPDPHTDLDETLAVLTDLVHDGKIRAIGGSMFPAELIVEGQWVAQQRCRERFRVEEPQYSIFMRGAERHVLETCRKYDQGVLVWGVLNSGWLTGKYRKGHAIPEGSRASSPGPWAGYYDFADERKLDIVESLLTVASEAGITLIQLAMAWALEHPSVASAIVGAKTVDQLEAQLAATDVRLSEDVLDAVDAIVPPGSDFYPEHAGFTPQGLTKGARRR